jgi:hygromycin-B 7''-O-kinase
MSPTQFHGYTLAPQDVSRLCRAAGLPDALRATRVAKGEVSAVFGLELADGRAAVLKVYLRNQNPTTLAAEHALLRHLHEHSTVPVPAWSVLDVSGRELPYPWAILERVGGVDADAIWPRLDAAAARRLVRGCGALLAALHAVPPQSPELTAAHLPPAAQWARREDEEFTRSVQRLAQQGWIDPKLLQRAEQVWADGAAMRAMPFKPALCHGDFQLWNIRVDPDTLEPVGLLDMGQAFLGPPSADGRDMEINLFLDRPALRTAFWQGYDAGELEECERERLRLAATCRALSLLAAYWGPTQNVTPAKVWRLLAPWSEDDAL